jgi:transposase
MILLIADGVPITAIAATIGISRRFVYKWAQRFLTQGVEGLADKPGRGSGRVLRQATLEGAARHGAALGSGESARDASTAPQ